MNVKRLNILYFFQRSQKEKFTKDSKMGGSILRRRVVLYVSYEFTMTVNLDIVTL